MNDYKRCIIQLTIFISLISCVAGSDIKISLNQEKLSAFIEKYQDSVAAAPDSIARRNILIDMYLKSTKLIQDSFKNLLDTFVFEKAVIKSYINPKDKQEYLEIYLDNGNYAALITVTGEQKAYLHASNIFRMAMNLREGIPVKAAGRLESVELSSSCILEGIKKIMLDVRVDTLYNAY